VGPAELRLRLRMSAAQARASAPANLSFPAQGFQAASCSVLFDASRCFRNSIPKFVGFTGYSSACMNSPVIDTGSFSGNSGK